MDKIPPLAGSYALRLLLASPVVAPVGRLGIFSFPAGDYLYLGSARGPGGLRARLAHHQKPPAHPHWHLDYFRPFAVVRTIFYTLAPENPASKMPVSAPLECLWSLSLAQMPGLAVPAKGFGAADCRSGCPAHLVLLPPGMRDGEVLTCLQTAAGEAHEVRGFFGQADEPTAEFLPGNRSKSGTMGTL